MKGQADIESMEQLEQNINSLKDIGSSVDEIIAELISQYENLELINQKWYRFKGSALEKYKKCLARLSSLKEALSFKLENDSKQASFLLMENFYSLYIFFSFLVSLAVEKKKELLLIEIVSRFDRYIDMIKPSFGNRSLHHDDMLYHYTLYEIKELRERVLKGLS